MSGPEDRLLLTERFTSAVEYARKIHIEFRKGTAVPYMAHLVGVAALVMGEAGHWRVPVTEDMVIAALLHDAVEDHGGGPRLLDIETSFGIDVAQMVEGLTDSFTDEHSDKANWEERKMAYIERLKGELDDVQLISVADKLYNAKAILEDYREIGPAIWQRFKRGRDQQLWYFNALIEVFQLRARTRIVEEFSGVVEELTELSKGEAVE